MHMTRARDESGFTLIELMMGMAIGIVVLFASFMLVDASAPLAQKTQDRVDAAQRGRLAMEIIGAELRSQVCMPGAVPPIMPTVSNATDIWFYGNNQDQDSLPQKHHIYIQGTALKEDTWQGTGSISNVIFPVNATPSTRTLVDPVALVPGVALFRFYGFDANLPASVNQPIAVPVSVPDSRRVVQVNVSFVARPTRATAAGARDSTFQQAVFFRTADPTDPVKGAKCQQ
jgi:prepilin-type N-terminal cleavage/methylation domain-containing protein